VIEELKEELRVEKLRNLRLVRWVADRNHFIESKGLWKEFMDYRPTDYPAYRPEGPYAYQVDVGYHQSTSTLWQRIQERLRSLYA